MPPGRSGRRRWPSGAGRPTACGEQARATTGRAVQPGQRGDRASAGAAGGWCSLRPLLRAQRSPASEPHAERARWHALTCPPARGCPSSPPQRLHHTQGRRSGAAVSERALSSTTACAAGPRGGETAAPHCPRIAGRTGAGQQDGDARDLGQVTSGLQIGTVVDIGNRSTRVHQAGGLCGVGAGQDGGAAGWAAGRSEAGPCGQAVGCACAVNAARPGGGGRGGRGHPA